jgi:6-pyruvoyltetrahydropterin/6-carboxytetrahydropterin synthase
LQYQGDCENLHGHNWKVDVTVAARDLDKSGLGIDFKVLKAETRRLLEALDHKYLNDLPMFKGLSPSSENIARHLFDELSRTLNTENVTVTLVNVWESDFACASYSLE